MTLMLSLKVPSLKMSFFVVMLHFFLNKQNNIKNKRKESYKLMKKRNKLNYKNKEIKQNKKKITNE